MKTTLILIRHGETQWNRDGVFRGKADVPLNERGLAQADAVGRHLAGRPFGAVFTSPLKRALDTARAVAKAKDGDRIIVQDAGLADIDRGEWQGLRREAVQGRFPDLYARWFSDPESVTFPSGESLADLQARALPCVARVAKEHEGSAAALVTHHVVLRVLLCGLLGVGLSRFRGFEVEPASISELEFEYGRWTLTRLNDLCPIRG